MVDDRLKAAGGEWPAFKSYGAGVLAGAKTGKSLIARAQGARRWTSKRLAYTAVRAEKRDKKDSWSVVSGAL